MCGPSPLTLFFSVLLGSVVIFLFHTSQNKFVEMYKIRGSDFEIICVESIQQIEKGWHFDNIGPINEHEISLHLFSSSLICFIRLYGFSCINLIYILLYVCLNISIFNTNVSDAMILIFNSNCSFLSYGKTIDLVY